MRQHSKPLAGVGYLVLLALLVTLSIKAFQKELPWQDAATVTLSTSTPGLELNPHSDVKFQGLRVGEVRRITSDGRVAKVELALDHDKLKHLPANVDAAIVPKTLFGEKFVDLKTPAQPSTARLADGGEIRQSTTSVEIGTLFSNLVPVLEALKPEQLSVILNGLAQALDGRGETLARTLNQLKGFATELDPHLANLTHDIDQFAKVAEVYADGAPDLARMLEATAGISRELLMPQEQKFSAFLDQVGATADDTEAVLAENAESLIKLSGRSRPVLALLDSYRSMLPCTLEGLRTFDTLGTHAIGANGPFTPITVEVIVQNEPYTYPRDLPSNPTSDANNKNLPKAIPGWEPHCPLFSEEVLALKPAKPNSQVLGGTTIDPPGSTRAAPEAAVGEARRALARAMAAQALGLDPAEVPGYTDLLVGPLLTDGEMTVR